MAAVAGSSLGIPDCEALARNAWLATAVPSVRVLKTWAVKLRVTSPAGEIPTEPRAGVVVWFQVMVPAERFPPWPGTMLMSLVVSTVSVTTTLLAGALPVFLTTTV